MRRTGIPNCSEAYIELQAAQSNLRKCVQNATQPGEDCLTAHQRSAVSVLSYAQCKREACDRFPEKLSPVLCRSPSSPLSLPACHSELEASDSVQLVCKMCRRESIKSRDVRSACWNEVRFCKKRVYAEHRAMWQSVERIQSILNGCAYLLYWILAFVGFARVRAVAPSDNRWNQLARNSGLVVSVLLVRF